MKTIQLIILGIFLVGCVATKDLNRKRSADGSGYREEEIGPGIFSIRVQTGELPMSAKKAAWRRFHKRAVALTGCENYLVSNGRAQIENNGDVRLMIDHMFISVRSWVTIVEGYVISCDCTLTIEEINEVIRRRKRGFGPGIASRNHKTDSNKQIESNSYGLRPSSCLI